MQEHRQAPVFFAQNDVFTCMVSEKEKNDATPGRAQGRSKNE
jgi:hypothetical protein